LGPAAAHVFMDVKDGQAVYDETTAPKLQTIFMPFLGGTEPEPLFAQMMDMWGVDDEQVLTHMKYRNHTRSQGLHHI